MKRGLYVVAAIVCVLVIVLACLESYRVRAACENDGRGGRYLCESRFSCACYHGAVRP